GISLGEAVCVQVCQKFVEPGMDIRRDQLQIRIRLSDRHQRSRERGVELVHLVVQVSLDGSRNVLIQDQRDAAQIYQVRHQDHARAIRLQHRDGVRQIGNRLSDQTAPKAVIRALGKIVYEIVAAGPDNEQSVRSIGRRNKSLNLRQRVCGFAAALGVIIGGGIVKPELNREYFDPKGAVRITALEIVR